METVAHCRVEGCGWHESWTTKEAAESAAAWHVWENHRDLWIHIIKEDRPPDHVPPALLGRLGGWESQR